MKKEITFKNYCNYNSIHTLKKKYDVHVFFLPKSTKESILLQLQKISQLLHLSAPFPKKIISDFNGNMGQEIIHYVDDYKIYIYGYGDNKKNDSSLFYHLSLKIGKHIDCKENILLHLISDNEIKIHHQVCGFILGHYHFMDLKTMKESTLNKKHSITFYHPQIKTKKIIEKYITLSKIQNEIRFYMNLPSNILRISTYISLIRKNIPKNVSLRVLQKKDLQKLGLDLILGVNQGSNQNASLLILEYASSSAEKKKKPICMIGKGVMFDSGGYDIKMKSMLEMKYDMTGSAIVYGAIKAHSLLKSKGHYISLLPLVENMVSENAIRPSDILTSYSGKTVEITNTDAEGRLIIADSISYAIDKYKPSTIIDLGTLSGEAVHIFNSKSSVIMGNNDKYIQKYIKMSKNFEENTWELPLWDIYKEDLISSIADIRNTCKSGHASTICIGSFLSYFVPENINWVHLDIAGVDYVKDSPYYYDGGKGEPMKSLYAFTSSL